MNSLFFIILCFIWLIIIILLLINFYVHILLYGGTDLFQVVRKDLRHRQFRLLEQLQVVLHVWCHPHLLGLDLGVFHLRHQDHPGQCQRLVDHRFLEYFLHHRHLVEDLLHRIGDHRRHLILQGLDRPSRLEDHHLRLQVKTKMTEFYFDSHVLLVDFAHKCIIMTHVINPDC